MRRRDFVTTSTIGGVCTALAPNLLTPRKTAAQAPEAAHPDIVAVRNGDPDAMFDSAIEAIGGMERFVKKGQKVVVKPNIGWPRDVESGANTNPVLVKRVVESCLESGADKVYVFDHSVGERNAECYRNSGIEEAAKSAGAVVAPGGEQRHFQKVDIPGGQTLTTADVHELVLECDVLINVPVLKHHKGARATIAMKNLMGAVWDRRAYHKQGLHQCIADFCLFRKPDLNIVDGYRVTMANGPQRARPEDVLTQKMLLASTDIVAVDAAAVKILGSTPDETQHIALAHGMKLGNMDLEEQKIEKIVL